MKIERKGLLLECKSSSVLCCGDFHVPQHNWDMIHWACQQGCRDLIINGDFFNLDSMSDYQRKQSGCDWEAERECATDILRVLLENFKCIVMDFGNHDKRISKKTNYVMGQRDLIALTVRESDRWRIVTTELDHVHLDDGYRKWRICHSLEYSRNHCQKPEAMGKKYGRNIIQNHTHILAEKKVYYGDTVRYYIEGGCMVDMDKVEYEQFNTSTFTNWGNGFIKLVNGDVEIITNEKIGLKNVQFTVDANGKFGYEKTLWERERV